MKSMTLREYPIQEMPREKLEKYGKENLTNSELLAIILGCGTKKKNVIELSKEIIKNNSLEKLHSYNSKKLCEINGINNAQACRIIASFELCSRLNSESKKQINSAKDAANIILNQASCWEQEKSVVLILNVKKFLINTKIVSTGILDSNLIHPREIFRDAISENAAAIILMHNHPSGDLTPSEEDITVSKELYKAGKIVGIEFLDHIIISKYKYLSLKEYGVI